MEATMNAIEVTGTVDEQHQLRLDAGLALVGPARVKVIILYPLTDEWDESEWLRAATHNPVFDFLREPEEDIYSSSDGKPSHDQA